MPIWVVIILTLAAVFFLAKALFVFSIAFALPFTQGALFVPTSNKRIEAFLGAVPMNPGDFLVDLGCGDGRVLKAAHKRYQVRALGFEINLLAYFAARIRTRRRPEIRIKRKDFHKADLREADVVFCYLFPDVLKDVVKKLEAEIRPGTRVVSCNFPLPGWSPLEVLRPASSRHGDPIYIYRKPDATITPA